MPNTDGLTKKQKNNLKKKLARKRKKAQASRLLNSSIADESKDAGKDSEK
jgi:hypothetical protein